MECGDHHGFQIFQSYFTRSLSIHYQLPTLKIHKLDGMCLSLISAIENFWLNTCVQADLFSPITPCLKYCILLW